MTHTLNTSSHEFEWSHSTSRPILIPRMLIPAENWTIVDCAFCQETHMSIGKKSFDYQNKNVFLIIALCLLCNIRYVSDLLPSLKLFTSWKLLVKLNVNHKCTFLVKSESNRIYKMFQILDCLIYSWTKYIWLIVYELVLPLPPSSGILVLRYIQK